MSKTNHRTDGKADIKFPPPGKDYCNGKRGERRDVAGAKKFIHSRHRAKTKTNLAELAKAEEGTDYFEVARDLSFDANYFKRYNKHEELLPWSDGRSRRFNLELKGRGYHEVPGTRNSISKSITNCPGCSICKAK